MTPMTPKERGEMERRSKRREELLRGRYPEVHGKVVDFITHTIERSHNGIRSSDCELSGDSLCDAWQ